jgi:hypothetical protein
VGRLVYGDQGSFELDDRTLAHLKLAVSTKLRRGETFVLNWTIPAAQGSGRVSLWLAPSISLQFEYSEAHSHSINRSWVEALIASAWSHDGMTLMSEDEALVYLAGAMPASRAPRSNGALL